MTCALLVSICFFAIAIARVEITMNGSFRGKNHKFQNTEHQTSDKGPNEDSKRTRLLRHFMYHPGKCYKQAFFCKKVNKRPM